MAKMLRGEVKRLALEHLSHVPTLRTAKFAEEIDVPYPTVRRAFKELITDGLVEFFHGGISAISSTSSSVVAPASKTPQVLASTVDDLARLIQNGQAIILDWSPLTRQLAQHVSIDLRAIVITNSPVVATSFSEHRQVEVRMIGGRLHNEVLVPTEEEETKFLEIVHVDLCVLGLCDIDRKIGISTSDLDQRKIRKAMISNASNVVVQVSDENLGSASPYIIGPFSKITHIVTCNSVADEKLKPYEDSGITILRG